MSGQLLKGWNHNIILNGCIQYQRLHIPVLGHVSNSLIHGHSGIFDLCAVCTGDLSGEEMFCSVESFPQFMHPALCQTADPQDLPFVEFQTYIFHLIMKGDIFCPQYDLVSMAAIIIRPIIRTGQLTAHHQLPHPVDLHFLLGQGIDQDSIPEHCDGIANAHQFIQIMGNKQHRFVFRRHIPHNVIDNFSAFLR